MSPDAPPISHQAGPGMGELSDFPGIRVSEKVGVGQRGLRLIFPLPQSRKKPPAISLDGEGRRLYLAEPASYCGCKPVRIQLARNNISSWRKEAERMSVA